MFRQTAHLVYPAHSAFLENRCRRPPRLVDSSSPDHSEPSISISVSYSPPLSSALSAAASPPSARDAALAPRYNRTAHLPIPHLNSYLQFFCVGARAYFSRILIFLCALFSPPVTVCSQSSCEHVKTTFSSMAAEPKFLPHFEFHCLHA